MIKYIEHKGNKYLHLQSTGNAARWIMPLAQYFCKGAGFDIGACKQEWAFPTAMIIDPAVHPSWGFDAMNLPDKGEADYIFSSHCLEHIKENWANVLDYWLSKLKKDGVLFLYLPHNSQTYWHPTSNRKHIHSFDGSEIKAYLESLGYEPYVTPVDFNNSFAVICYKTKVKQVVKGHLFNFNQADSHGDVFLPNAMSIGLGITDCKFQTDKDGITVITEMDLTNARLVPVNPYMKSVKNEIRFEVNNPEWGSEFKGE